MNDLISVVVPVYNVQMYLKRCLQSIKQQSYQNIEIIIVDDILTDESGKIADVFSSLEPRANVIHKKMVDCLVLRNVGINHAKGRYITFIDSDDYIAKDYIEYLYRLIKNMGSKWQPHFIESSLILMKQKKI